MPASYANLQVTLVGRSKSSPAAQRIAALRGDAAAAPLDDPAGLADAIARPDIVAFIDPADAERTLSLIERSGAGHRVRAALTRTLVAAADDATAAALVERGIRPDFEPDVEGAVTMVDELARIAPALLERKRHAASIGIDTLAWRRTDMRWDGHAASIDNSLFMKAARREPTPRTPTWLMRQAGRYQRHYRKVRERTTMLGLCHAPQLAADVTLMAVERLGVDAAIIFADILLVLETLGLHVDFVKGDGPVIDPPVRSAEDVDRLLPGDADALAYVYEAIALTRRSLRPDVALIGFCGAPFTVASYMIEGGKTKDFARTKRFMLEEPAAWAAVMNRLVRVQGEYLRRQIDAGADAVQVFDSWAGVLTPDDYRRFVLPHTAAMIRSLDRAAPVIHFATGNPALNALFAQTGASIVGLDFRSDLAEAWDALGDDVAVMGNLDPTALYGEVGTIRARVKEVLDKAAGRPGHIFNLGHGITPDMSEAKVAACVDAVRELSARPLHAAAASHD